MNSGSPIPGPRRQLREPAIILGNADLVLLRAVVERHLDGSDRPASELLEAELDRAIVVPQAELPPEIVTMGSRIVFRDVGTGRSRVITLCHSDEADPANRRISILAPVATPGGSRAVRPRSRDRWHQCDSG